MTTIIIIVVVALVFFVTICVVTFMVWKREAEMRTDSIKAIENNLEEVLYELTGDQTAAVKNRVRKNETPYGSVIQDMQELQQNINDKLKSENKAIIEERKSLDPFSWVRSEEPTEKEHDAEDDHAENTANDERLKIFKPMRKVRERVKWTEVSEEKAEAAVKPEAAEMATEPKTVDAFVASASVDAEDQGAVAEPSAPEAEDPSRWAAGTEAPENSIEDELEDYLAGYETTSDIWDLYGGLEEKKQPEPVESDHLKAESPAETEETDVAPEVAETDEPAPVDLEEDEFLKELMSWPVDDILPEISDEEMAADSEGHSEEETKFEISFDFMEPGNTGVADGMDDMADLEEDAWFDPAQKPQTGYNTGRSGKKYTVSELEALIKE